MADQRTTLLNADPGARVVAQDIYEESSSQKHQLGERLVLGDRVFRYAKNGSAALSAGYVVASNVTAVRGVTYAAYGEGTIKVSLSCASGAIGDYRDGYLVLTHGSGAGNTYKIKDNDAVASGYISLTLQSPLAQNMSTATSGLIATSRYNAVLTSGTTGATNDPIGVPLVAVTANYYFWVQTWGPAGVLIGALTVGDLPAETVLTTDTATGGALYPMLTGTGTNNTVTAGAGVSGVPIAKAILTSPRSLATGNSAVTALVQLVDLVLDP